MPKLGTRRTISKLNVILHAMIAIGVRGYPANRIIVDNYLYPCGDTGEGRALPGPKAVGFGPAKTNAQSKHTALCVRVLSTRIVSDI